MKEKTWRVRLQEKAYIDVEVKADTRENADALARQGGGNVVHRDPNPWRGDAFGTTLVHDPEADKIGLKKHVSG